MTHKFTCVRCFETLEHPPTHKALTCWNCSSLLKMEQWYGSESSGWKSSLLPDFKKLPSGEYEPVFRELVQLDEEWEKVKGRDQPTGLAGLFLTIGLVILLLCGILEAALEAGGIAILFGIVAAAILVIPPLIHSRRNGEIQQRRSIYGTRRTELLIKLRPFRNNPERATYI